jgi:copper chaperone NosL
VRTALAFLITLLLAGCESKPRGPVGLERDDACASCRMLISERRYAAELIDSNGEIYKFDDIACMLRFAHSRRMDKSSSRFYVTNYATGDGWIDATAAHFVRLQSRVSSPMASGIVALRDAGNAAATSIQKDVPLTFDELWAKDVSEISTRVAARTKP